MCASALISGSQTDDESKHDTSFANLFNLTKTDSIWVENTLDAMTLEEKIAQMIIMETHSRDTSEEGEFNKMMIDYVENVKIGGIIFFHGNIYNQVFLENKLQKLSELPLLISSDFERGLGTRLHDAVEFPFNMAFAATNNTDYSYMMGKIVADESRAVGVHHNYAPIIDINDDYKNPVINLRAYSDNPYVVASHALAFTKGMHKGKVLTTAKHFPGHGSANVDSHADLPLIDKSSEEFRKWELVPFQVLIKGGVKSIMTAHLDVPALNEDEGIPATLSHSVITDLLKTKLNFSGLVVTDAMTMRAITNYFSNGESAKLAVQAGNDIILMPEEPRGVVEELASAVELGEITEYRINNSVRKILAAKRWLKLEENRYINYEEILKELQERSHWRLAQEVAEKSITLLKDDDNLLPVNPADYKKPVCIILDPTNYKEENKRVDEVIKENFDNVEIFRLTRKSKGKDFNKALYAAKKSDLVILASFVQVWSFGSKPEDKEIFIDTIDELADLDAPTVMLNMGNPYIVNEVDTPPALLLSYGYPALSQHAAVDAMLGNISITGKLPVSIPGTNYNYGYGITKRNTKLRFIKEQTDTNYNFAAVDAVVKQAISDEAFPGAVVLVGHKGKVVHHKAYGTYTYEKNAEPMPRNAVFDLASVTKVIGTTSAAMLLHDKGLLDLDAHVTEYLPELNNHGKDKIKIRNLLLHNAGFVPYVSYYKKVKTGKEVIDDIMNSELKYETGTKFVYSDHGMIVLQKVIERITGKPIDEFLKEELFAPLNMNNTFYNPPDSVLYRTVPTEVDDYWRMITLRGKVHDENAYLLGGVAGHAGMFSTAADIAKVLQTLLNGGVYDGKRFFDEETVDDWTTKQSNQSTRGLGWDTKSETRSSSGTKFSINSFGHTGYTGTSVWVDKEKDLFVIFLTNRVHPTRDNRKIVYVRPVLHDAIVDAVTYFQEEE